MKNIDEILQDMKAINLNILDFQWILQGDKTLSSLIPLKAAASLSVFAKQASGSLIAIWNEDKSNDIDCPIVWIDSEGFPNSVIAADINEFLSLLPYGTGEIYNIAYGLSRFLENQKSNKRYLKKFTAKYFKDRLKELEKEKLSKSIADYINSQFGVPVSIMPLDNMQKAMGKKANFQLWLESMR